MKNEDKKSTLEENKEPESLNVFSSKNLLNIEMDLTVSKTFGSKGKFTLELPNNFQKLEIERKVTQYFETNTVNIPERSYAMAMAMTTLETILTKCPEWWPGALICYDQKLIIDLFNWYLEEESKLNKKLKKNKLGAISQ